MENQASNQKANRILYTAVVAVLCLAALIIGIVAVANREDAAPTPSVTTPQDTPTTPPEGNPDTPPSDVETSAPAEYLCPLIGTVAKKHTPDDLLYSPSMGDWRTHEGLDIAAALGDTVTVTADGTVKEIWEDDWMGTCVSVDHGAGVISVYKNLAATLADGVAVGTSLDAGDALGCVGESAMAELADAPHLHFELTVDGVAVDPLSYFSEESISACLGELDTSYED